MTLSSAPIHPGATLAATWQPPHNVMSPTAYLPTAGLPYPRTDDTAVAGGGAPVPITAAGLGQAGGQLGPGPGGVAAVGTATNPALLQRANPTMTTVEADMLAAYAQALER